MLPAIDVTGQLRGLLVSAGWAWCLTAWCMCAYIACASREGLRWFRPAHNPWLILSAITPALVRLACSGANAAAACDEFATPRPGAVLFAAAVWATYAALVSHQHQRQIRVHVLPACAPLPLLALGYAWVS